MTSQDEDKITAAWRSVLTEGSAYRPFSYLPGGHRCRICDIPIGGLGGFILKALRGREPSPKNPQVCNQCDTKLPHGGAEIDIAIMFADVRGSTSLGERLGPSAFADTLNKFYEVSHRVLVPRGAVIDKMIGDEVMAFFIPAIDQQYRRVAVETAVELQRSILSAQNGSPLLPVGIGVHAGTAFVGKVGTDDVSDLTALGDTVNTAARLQSVAEAGEVVISEELAQVAPSEFDHARTETLDIQGKEQPLAVRVVKIAV